MIRIWDSATGKVKYSLDRPDATSLSPVTTLAISADGKWMITYGIQTWYRSGDASPPGTVGGYTQNILWALDYPGVLAAGAGSVPESNVAQKYLKAKRLAHVCQIALSPDGKRVAYTAGGESISLEDVDYLDFHDGKVAVVRMPRKLLQARTGFASCVAFAPDGKSLASAGGEDKAVHWWQPVPDKDPTILASLQHDAIVIRVGFTQDGKTLAAGDEGGILKLWDLDARKERYSIKAHQGDVGALAVSPDGKIIATGGPDKTIKLWEVATGKNLATLADQKGRIQALAFSPDGKTLASSACDPFEKGEVKLWSVAKILEQKPAP